MTSNSLCPECLMPLTDCRCFNDDKQPTSADAPSQPSIDDVLNKRGTRYGKFVDQANLSFQLRNIIFGALNERKAPVPPYIQEALILICHKLARIANGDPLYDDNYRDIAGYAELVVKELNGAGV